MSTIVFRSPAAAWEIDQAESSLQLRFPTELRELLEVSNGIEGEYGLGLLWSLERIVEENLKFRESKDLQRLYMPFDGLLFLADAGNGDQFAFSVAGDGVIHRPDVFVWDHENDSRRWVAPSLRLYLEWWITGQMTL